MTTIQPIPPATSSSPCPDQVMYAALRMFLPGLPEDQVGELAVRTYDQVEFVVGQRLSQGLTDAQLEEFEKLIDDQQEDKCSEWLERSVPDYRRVVAASRIETLAEVVRVVSADPSALLGQRWFEELVRPDLDMVREILTERGSAAATDATDGAVLVRIGDGHVVVWAEAAHGPRRFMVRCEASAPISSDDLSAVEKLRRQWNSACPIVTLNLYADAASVHAVAEGGISLGAGMSRAQVVHHLDLAHDAIGEVMSLVASIVE